MFGLEKCHVPQVKHFFRKDKNKSTLQKNVISFTGDHRCPSHVSLGLLAHGWLRSRDRGSWLGSTGLPHLGCQTLRVTQPCTSIVCSQTSCSFVFVLLGGRILIVPIVLCSLSTAPEVFGASHYHETTPVLLFALQWVFSGLSWQYVGQ